MSNNEADNERRNQIEEFQNTFSDFLEYDIKSMCNENDEVSKIFENENNNEYNSKDMTTANTKEKTNNNLGNKIKLYDEDEEIKDENQIKKIQNEFNEEKKNKDLIKDESFGIFFVNKHENEESIIISFQEQENIYKEPKKYKKSKKKFISKMSDLISQKNNQKVRFDGTVKKVKKLFFHHILKISNEILEKKGILKKFRIPSHDFTKNVTIESNKFILTIDIKSLFCSTFKNNSPIGDVLKKKIEDNKSIFKNYSFLEKEYYHIFCSPLENLLNDYLHSHEFIEDVRNVNAKCKKNPILLDRIIGEGENDLINYFKFNNRYGKK